MVTSIDRYLCSSSLTNIRAWSNIRVANRVITLITILLFTAYVHVPVFFRIDIIPATQKPICYPPGPPGTYRIILSYFNLVVLGLSPSLLMLIFGLLTLRNVERSKQLIVAPTTNAPNATYRKTNTHMIRMLIVQVFVYCITGLTFSVALIYTAINASRPKTIFDVAQENMINATVGMMSTVGPCLSFYLFTLPSGLFRKELKNLFSGIHNYVDHFLAVTNTTNTNRRKSEH